MYKSKRLFLINSYLRYNIELFYINPTSQPSEETKNKLKLINEQMTENKKVLESGFERNYHDLYVIVADKDIDDIETKINSMYDDIIVLEKYSVTDTTYKQIAGYAVRL